MQGPSRFIIALIILSVIAIAIIAFGLLSWQKLMFDKQQKDVQINNNKNELSNVSNQLLQKPKFLRELDQKTAELGNLDRELVDYKFVPTYLRQIQNAAKETGNQLQSITPTDPVPLDLTKPPFNQSNTTNPAGQGSTDTPPPAAGSPVSSKPPESSERVMHIGLDVKGTYVSILKFLDLLRGFPKLIYVKTVSLTPSRNPDGSLIIAGRFETYVIIPPDQYKTPEDRKTPSSGNPAP